MNPYGDDSPAATGTPTRRYKVCGGCGHADPQRKRTPKKLLTIVAGLLLLQGCSLVGGLHPSPWADACAKEAGQVSGTAFSPYTGNLLVDTLGLLIGQGAEAVVYTHCMTQVRGQGVEVDLIPGLSEPASPPASRPECLGYSFPLPAGCD